MHDGRREPAALGIRDDERDAGVDRRHERIGRAEVDADNGVHALKLPRIFRTEQAFLAPDLCPQITQMSADFLHLRSSAKSADAVDRLNRITNFHAPT
jgi:hypothetical protein